MAQRLGREKTRRITLRRGANNHSSHSVDHRALVVVQLLTQVGDVKIHDAGTAAESVVPHLIENLIPRESRAPGAASDIGATRILLLSND